MKKTRFTEEQIAVALRRAELGMPVAEVARAFEVNPNVLHRWRREFRQGSRQSRPALLAETVPQKRGPIRGWSEQETSKNGQTPTKSRPTLTY